MTRALGKGTSNLEMGSVEKRHYAGWPKRADEDVNHVRQAFIRSPKKMIS
jgi:hypothetical protein